MTPTEMRQLEGYQPSQPVFTAITASMFTSNVKNRTLLYGYTLERDSFHVYLRNTVVLIAKYAYRDVPTEVFPKAWADYVPSKRIYPESADFEFCVYLQRLNVRLPFTTFGVITRRPEGNYWGEIL